MLHASSNKFLTLLLNTPDFEEFAEWGDSVVVEIGSDLLLVFVHMYPSSLPLNLKEGRAELSKRIFLTAEMDSSFYLFDSSL